MSWAARARRASGRYLTDGGHPSRAAGLVVLDLVQFAKGQADLVPAIEEPLLEEWFHLEVELDGAGVDRLRFEGDDRLRLRRIGSEVEEPPHGVLGERYHEHPDVAAVAHEDVGEGGGDDHVEAGLLERPRRVLAG